MDEKRVKRALGELIEAGLVKPIGKDGKGEWRYKLEPEGEIQAEELLGGKDVGQLATNFVKFLEITGDIFGNDINENPGGAIRLWASFLLVAQFLKRFLADETWKELGEEIGRLVKEESR